MVRFALVAIEAFSQNAVMMLHVGTMGFSYSDWAGVFYPQGTKPAHYLAHYAQHFDCVELDTTFYAVPPVERVRRWAELTPESFKFCPKVPKAITHEGAMEHRLAEMRQFLEVMREFGSKLAVVLIQLPPFCGVDQFEGLQRLLESLPREIRFAVEFRNASWGNQPTLDLLRGHRCALVAAEYLSRPAWLHLTTDFTYIRLIGKHDQFKELSHEQVDVNPSLEWWKAQIEHHAPSIGDTFVLFNNDYYGYAITTARRFMKRMGMEVREAPQERTLFG